MPRIKPLDLQTANSIAAGEVVERPASVVKELVENSLDAGADTIHITIRQGGVRQIKVSDNGCGMSAEDALLAFGRHTTSKLRQIEDLDHLTTMGFRGEALASIAAVSQVNLQTREPGADQGFALKINGGTLEDSGPAGCPDGTVINIENLFFNVPARFKFLRKDATEAGVITDIVTRLALARPDVSFRLLHNDQEILHTPGNHDLSSTIYALFGRDIAKACLSIKAEQPPVLIVGQVGRPEIARGSRSQQIFLVNGRVIRSRVLTAALGIYNYIFASKHYALATLNRPDALRMQFVHTVLASVCSLVFAVLMFMFCMTLVGVTNRHAGLFAEPEFRTTNLKTQRQRLRVRNLIWTCFALTILAEAMQVVYGALVIKHAILWIPAAAITVALGALTASTLGNLYYQIELRHGKVL